MATKWHHVVISAIAVAVTYQISGHAWRLLSSSEAAPSPQAIQKGLAAARERLLPTLPQKIDEVTSYTDVRVEGTSLIYVYDVQAEFGETELKQEEGDLRRKVCSSVMSKDIANGVTYAFEYWSMVPARRLVGRLSISNCP